jgi:hypothetical protein
VPILITMDEPDHLLVAEEAWGSAGPAADQEGGGGAAAGGRDEALLAALARARALQDYLAAFEAAGLPVVRLQYGQFGEVLDKLHEYILQCIKLAMMQQV